MPKPNGWVALTDAQVPATAGVATCVVSALTTAIVATHPGTQPKADHPAAEKIVTADTLSSEDIEITTEEDTLEVRNILNEATKADTNSETLYGFINERGEEIVPTKYGRQNLSNNLKIKLL